MNKAVMIAIIIAVLVIGIVVVASESNTSLISNVKNDAKADSKNYHLELNESVGVTGP